MLFGCAFAAQRLVAVQDPFEILVENVVRVCPECD